MFAFVLHGLMPVGCICCFIELFFFFGVVEDGNNPILPCISHWFFLFVCLTLAYDAFMSYPNKDNCKLTTDRPPQNGMEMIIT